MSKPGDYGSEFPRGSSNAEQLESNADHNMQGKYFNYGSPHYAESGFGYLSQSHQCQRVSMRVDQRFLFKWGLLT